MDPRKTLRIARWEITTGAGTLNRRSLALIVAGGLLGLLVGPAVIGGGVALDEGIYRVGVDADSPYAAVVEENAKFARGPPERAALDANRIDLLIESGGDGRTRIRAEPSAKSRAALSELRSAVQSFNDAVAAGGADRAAAFPVNVTVQYESRNTSVLASGGGGRVEGGGSGGGGGDGGGEAGSDGESGGGGDVGVPNLGGALTGSQTAQSPGGLQPPFPFASLVLAFAFIVPMNFVIQAYGSTMLDERINRRGELLLVAPLSRGDIIAGKTLPYFLGQAGVTVAIAAAVGGGIVSVAAVLPIALLFLAATFLGAMFARSFKELTFVTLSISVFLTSYAFVPAIFTDITPISLISPLTLVVRDLTGEAVTAAQYAFSTGPFYFASSVLFVLGAGIYREEDLFTQRAVPLKALDAFAARVRSVWRVGLWTALFIPFVFIVELLAVAVLFALPFGFSLPVILLVVALIEELAKSIHVYAGYEHARYDRSVRTALLVGAASGVGFFLGEKATLVVQVVGLPEFRLGRAAFATGFEVTPALALILLIAPLVLHVVTATISSLGARAGRIRYAIGYAVAVIGHVTYNAGVIAVAG